MEEESQAVMSLLEASTPVTSRLSQVEITSAIQRRHAENELSSADRDRALYSLREDLKTMQIIEITGVIAETATGILARQRIRASDAIHLASAVETGRILGARLPFISYDARLSEAARREGLTL
jgi:predicted nucleic acid-binding protein